MGVTDFPRENLPWIMGALGKFPWKREEGQRIPHDSSRGSMGYDNLLSGSANHKTVKCTKMLKSRVEFVLCSSWRQILTKLGLKFYKTTVF